MAALLDASCGALGWRHLGAYLARLGAVLKAMLSQMSEFRKTRMWCRFTQGRGGVQIALATLFQGNGVIQIDRTILVEENGVAQIDRPRFFESISYITV